jgi:DNA uptake protein ComE-like DNA-binding protein
MRPPRFPEVWTHRHRQVVIAGVTLALAGLAIARWRQPTALPDPPGDGSRAAELAVRIDPNTADAAALSALPGMGPSRAHAIVDYRAAYAARHPGHPAFTSPRDLLPVKGVGTATAANLAPYLSFPTTAP